VSGDAASLSDLLAGHPELSTARSERRHRATLLHYLGANGVEGYRQRTPPNAVEIGAMLLDAGAEVDALANLYDEQCTTMSMLVSSSPPAAAGLQGALVELLLDRGAAFDGQGSKWHSALMTALTFGFLDTGRLLARRGAPHDTLPAAAGLGLADDARRLLPGADQRARHVALALAAQLGHAEVVQVFIDAGEELNRLNPEGLHAHSTPLHQAVAAGHLEVVKRLVTHGARLDQRDTLYLGTPLDWAEHCEQPHVAAYLREAGTSRV
jgi:ankyrin repeat protein